jgi:hypothetical protein
MVAAQNDTLWEKSVETMDGYRFRGTARRAMLWCAVAALTCIGVVGDLNLTASGVRTLIDSALAASAPPDDAQPMSPGQRVRRPYGWVEIRTFNRSQKSTDAIFEVEFLLINESAESIRSDLSNFVRLIADGIPRAPSSWQVSADKVLPDSAEYCNAKFTVKGRPRAVYVQFGTEDSGLNFLRWPG